MKDMCIAYDQYYGCWWPADVRGQGISSNGIDIGFLKYSGLSFI